MRKVYIYIYLYEYMYVHVNRSSLLDAGLSVVTTSLGRLVTFKATQKEPLVTLVGQVTRLGKLCSQKDRLS